MVKYANTMPNYDVNANLEIVAYNDEKGDETMKKQFNEEKEAMNN